MKKSIVAMLSITALATVANAETWTGTGGTHFEGTTAGSPFLGYLDDSGSNTGPFCWFAATDVVYYCESQFGTYTNSADLGTYTGDRPAIAETSNTTNKCLAIETDGGRLYRKMAGDMIPETDPSSFVQYDVTSAIYFDSLVQFTVNEDDAPQVQAGDKLVVWLKGDEENGTTNLVVTAGFLDPDNSDPLVASNYVTSASVEPGTWHRLTIEAYNLVTSEGNPVVGNNQDAGYLGFRVRIDGQLLTTSDSVGDVTNFVSAIVGTGDATTDALTYAGNFELFPSLTYSANQCTSLSCVAFEGTGAVDDLTFTDTDPFAGAAPAVPTVDGAESADGAAFIAAATSGTLNTLPAGWTLDGNAIKDGNGDTYATIPAFYTPTLSDGTLTLVLNDYALPTIGAANVTVGEETEAKEAIEVDATTFTATLTSTSTKLYYGLKVAASPNAETWTAGELTQGTGAAMQISADKPKDGSDPLPAGFFKVYVTDIAPAAPTPEPAGE